jgi:Fe-S cluster assembly protein SufD
MSSLLTSLIAGSAREDSPQRSALQTLARVGLPGARSERWKYTSLRALERRVFSTAIEVATPDATALAHIPAPRLVFVNGFHNAALSDVSNLPDGVVLGPRPATDADAGMFVADSDVDSVFVRLNAAMARSGALLHVAAGTTCSTPLQLVFLGVAAASDQAWHLRHEISIEDGAAATVVEHHVALEPHQHLANHVLEVRLGANAILRHARVQNDADGASMFQSSDVSLDRHADYRRVDVELGAALSRHELKAAIAGEHARLTSGGVLFANGRRHVDTRMTIRHIARNTTCDLRWRGLASDRGRAVFHGGIVIEAGADGSDARLSSKNILLSASAEIDAQPVLEIHADEVKAAHGATVGQLDESALFYLRSRGLPLADARQLLIAAFCREPMDVLGDPALAGLLTGLIDASMATRGFATPESCG